MALITLLIMTILITLNMGETTYNDITQNINKGSIKYIFYLLLQVKLNISKISFKQSRNK